MDLYIKTLTGTAFELRVSPFETIMSVKAKIQRLEGIPMSQQHLIWRSVELEDDYCLHDYNISDGATLQLVLAMRGGPINTRRIPMEDPTLREMAEYMEANRDEIWDKLPKDNRQVTLLVFRDGDKLNFFRVVDRGDGTLTPLSDSLSGASMYNLYDEEEEDNPVPVSQETLQENSVTMTKMRHLKNKMETQKKEKVKMQPRPPSGEKPASSSFLNTRRRLQLSSAATKQHAMAMSQPRDSLKPSKVLHHHHHHGMATRTQGQATASAMTAAPKGPLPPVNTRKGNHIDVSDFLTNASQDTKVLPNLNRSVSRSAFKDGQISISELVKDSKELKPIGSISKHKGSSKEIRTSSPGYSSGGLEYASGSAHLRRSRIPENSVRTGQQVELSSDSAGYARRRRENQLATPESRNSALLVLSQLTAMQNDSIAFSHRVVHGTSSGHAIPFSVSPPTHLPPVRNKPHPPQLIPGKKKTRCSACGKKTGLATTYQCRCGNSFCATHRYAEMHSCTYDYKSEGRKILEQNNPVVAAPKLPKI